MACVQDKENLHHNSATASAPDECIPETRCNHGFTHVVQGAIAQSKVVRSFDVLSCIHCQYGCNTCMYVSVGVRDNVRSLKGCKNGVMTVLLLHRFHVLVAFHPWNATVSPRVRIPARGLDNRHCFDRVLVVLWWPGVSPLYTPTHQ